MAQFPRPDPATQGILGIRDVTARLVNGAYKSVYACTLVIDGTEAVVSVEVPPLEEAAVLDRLASQPPNPHVVSVLARYDAADADLSYLVSARLENDLFDQLITAGGPFPQATARNYFAQILGGLRHMHRLGVAHRDIKLENVMFNQQGVLRLIDYKRAAAMPTQPLRLQPGAPTLPIFDNKGHGRVGAPSCMAPEVVAAGQEGYDMFKADVWSLGCALFHMSTGSFFLRIADPGNAEFRWVRAAQEARSPLNSNGLSTVGAMYTMWQQPNPLNADLTDLLDGMLRINPAERMTLDDVCNSRWLSAVSAAIFAHDNVVPLAPELQAWVRAKVCWARLRRPIMRATFALLGRLLTRARTLAALRPSHGLDSGGRPAGEPGFPAGPEMLAAQAEFEETAPVHDSLPDALGNPAYQSLAASAGDQLPTARFRGLSAEDSPPPVVTTLEELEAAMEKMGVPREEPLPITREKSEPFRTA